MKTLYQPMSITALVLALGTPAVMAAPAIYSNGTLTIPAGAIFSDSKNTYLGDLVFEMDSTGKFTLVSSAGRPLTTVETVAANVVTSGFETTVELSLEGYKSVPCVALEEAAIFYANNSFTVLLAETVMGPAESCIAVTDPFALTLPLDVKDLPSGEYQVKVNSVSASFTLPEAQL